MNGRSTSYTSADALGMYWLHRETALATERRECNLTLREMRDRANLSCVQVGKKLFVDQSCVRHWEYGDWAPARKYYKKMAKLYGVSEEEIKAAAEAIRAANKEER